MGEFIQVIKDGATYGGDLRKVVEMIIDKAGLIRALQDEGTDEARGRVENIQEFLGVVDEFVQTHDAEESDFAAPSPCAYCAATRWPTSSSGCGCVPTWTR